MIKQFSTVVDHEEANCAFVDCAFRTWFSHTFCGFSKRAENCEMDSEIEEDVEDE